MAQIEVDQLTQLQIDWVIATMECFEPFVTKAVAVFATGTNDYGPYSPTTSREKGGYILEREKISTLWCPDLNCWGAKSALLSANAPNSFGETPLIAGLRCFIKETRGDVVTISDAVLEALSRTRADVANN